MRNEQKKLMKPTREGRSVEGGGGWGDASFGLQCRVAIGTIIADPFFGYFTAGRGAWGYDTTLRWWVGRTTTRVPRTAGDPSTL